MIAFLRGINVGARNRIAMAELREIMQDLGCREVRTHLQSGNVVFVAPARAGASDWIAHEIEHAIERRLGLNVPVLMRSADELAEVVERNPLADVASNPSRLLVTFLSAEAQRDRIAELDPERFLPDRFAAGEREIYVWAPRGASETKLTHSFWEKRLGVTATARNWNTVQRLLEIAAG